MLELIFVKILIDIYLINLLYKEIFMEDIEIIKKAYSILKEGYAFHNCTYRAKASYFSGLEDGDYKKLDDKLKAIRQGFAAILVTLNSIDRVYTSYKKGEYIPSYFSIMRDEATSEIGCLIEYMFVKYPVIIEYVLGVLKICILPVSTNEEKKDYKKYKAEKSKGRAKRNNPLLKHLLDNTTEDNFFNTKWFQQLKIVRNSIIHGGSVCWVPNLNEKKLVFKIWDIDSLDKIEKENEDNFYTADNNFIYYSRYWGLYISKLIIFVETIFNFLLKDTEMYDNNKYNLELLKKQEKSRLCGSNNVPDIQTVLENMLKSIIDNYNN